MTTFLWNNCWHYYGVVWRCYSAHINVDHKRKRNAENRTKWTPIRNSMKISSMCYVVAHLVRSVMINPLPPLNSVPSELNSALLNSKNPPWQGLLHTKLVAALLTSETLNNFQRINHIQYSLFFNITYSIENACSRTSQIAGNIPVPKLCSVHSPY